MRLRETRTSVMALMTKVRLQYIQEYIDAYYGRRSWQKLLQRTDIQTVLVEPIAPLASLLRESPDWQNAFEDQVAVVFIHRDATGSALNRSK